MGRTVVVTGGTGAIGSAVCERFARGGHDVAFTYRSNADLAERLRGDLEATGRRVVAAPVDLTDPDGTTAFVDSVADRFGGIDTLVHAAGPTMPQLYVSQIGHELFRRHVESEYVGFFNLVHPVLPHLRASRGSLVAVTAMAVHHYITRDSLSAGPKSAVEALVRAIALEEGRFGVRANNVAPGVVDAGVTHALEASGDFTPQSREYTVNRVPLGRFGTGAEIAEAVFFMGSDAARYITGQSLVVDGGLSI